MLGIGLERLHYRLDQVRDNSGLSVRLKVEYFELQKIQEMITSTPLFRTFLLGVVPRDRICFFLKKKLTNIDPLGRTSGTIWRVLILIQMALWANGKYMQGEAATVLFSYRRPWFDVIQRYSLQCGVTVESLGGEPFLDRKALKAFLPRSVRHQVAKLKSLWPYLRNAYLASQLSRQLRLEKRGVINHKDGALSTPSDGSLGIPSARGVDLVPRPPKLAVPYYGHLNLNSPELNSDLFFLQESELQGEDLLLLFSISRDPLDRKKLAEISDHGLEAAVLSHLATNIPSIPIFYHRSHTEGQIYDSKSPAKARSLRTNNRYLAEQLTAYHDSYDYWLSVFKHYHVRLYLTWFKYDATHCVIAEALKNLGGVSAVYQRSFEELGSPSTSTATDVIFGFSQNGVDIERSQHSTASYFVTTGFLGDHRFPLFRSHARTVRDRFRDHGVSFVLAYFDENTLFDSRWHKGHDFTRENYQFLLEKILSDPSLGLVVKPKNALTLRSRLASVESLLREAEVTGRCFVFESGAIQGSHPPVAAALVSDLAIHESISAATAGLESALAGVPTLLLDREGWPVSKLYRLGEGTVVFTSWEDLWAAVTDYRRSSKALSGFGDWAALLDELDPFRDGHAARRMGTYLKWLLDDLKSGQSREVAMADATERYCKAWGKDKVTQLAAGYRDLPSAQ